jgi:Tfp pilus assembly protein PilF
MKYRRPRSAALVLLVSFCGPGALASTAILHGPSPRGQALSVETYAGPVAVTVTASKPSASVTILILLNTLSPSIRDQIKADLLDYYPQLHGRTVQLAFLGTGEFAGPFPVSSRARFKQLLDRVATEQQIEPVIQPSLIDDLVAVVPKLGSSRSTLLLVGGFPKLDAASAIFASAVLAKACTGQQLRPTLISGNNVQPDWAEVFRSLGGDVVASVKDVSLPPPSSVEPFTQLDWTTPLPTAGFVVTRSPITDEKGAPIAEVPDLSVADGMALPSVQQYSDSQNKLTEAESLLAQEPLTQERADRIRADIQTALQLNPREPGALTVATSLYEKAKDYRSAVSMSALLVEVRPRDGLAFAAFGHVLLLHSELDRAEAALKRARDLGTANEGTNEDFARLQIARKDDKGALPYLAEVLRLDGKRQDVWFLQAEVAERAHDSALAEHSYEQGFSLGGVHIGEAGALLRLYVAAKNEEKVSAFAKEQLSGLPPVAEDRLEFAVVLDELHLSDLSLEAWHKVLEVQPASERAHTRVAQLLLDAGNASGAEEEANTGLSAAPKSAPLFLVKAEAEQRQGHRYESRHTLEEGAAKVENLALATELAASEEQFFGSASEAYARVAQLSAPSSPEQVHALERGFDMSMRDGDLVQAAKFASALGSSGRNEYGALLGGEKSADSVVMVPGGLSSLAFAAHASKEEIPPERFFLEYSRMLVNGGADSGKNPYLEGIRDYFDRLGALRALGTSASADVVITLSLTDKAAKHQTEKALGILGIRLKSSKGEVEIAQGENRSQAAKQETAAALAVDEVGIQEALQAGKPYRLAIHDEPASIFPSESAWREALNLKYGPGGFAEELVRVPRMASAYVALNSMDRGAAEELLKAIPLKVLCEHESDLLYYFAPALALEGAHAAVPGGAKAEALWTTLVGASPRSPGPFFRALLGRNDGRLLVYFSMLAQLDRAHQAFFTANESRAKQFYDLLAATSAMRTRPFAQFRDSGFQRMLRSVPLDDDGHVEFPGSPEVWTVAKGRSSTEAHTAQLMKKVGKAAAPDLEDALLVRMAGTQYKENNFRLTELDNFLAVSSVDAHRMEPMDEQSALLLAQSYADFAATYPYLTDLRTLTANDYRQFFSAFEHTFTHSSVDANLQLGQLHALTELICLMVQRRAINDNQAAELIRKMASGLTAAEDGASYTAASLETVRSILHACNQNISTADEALASCLLGRHAAASDERLKHYQRVLDAQRVPSLEAMLEIYDASNGLSSAKSPQQLVDVIQKRLDSFPAVDLPKELNLSGEEKNVVLRYDPGAARRVASQMKEKAAKKKLNPKDLEKLSRELQVELQGQVVAALSGPLYAYFLRSSDAIVMSDPLLLRKHHYVPFSEPGREHERVVVSDFNVTSEKGGSYFVGGFAQFPYSAGLAAAHSKNLAGGVESMAAQLATIRGADWDRFTESDQRLAALRIIVAREWVYESARKPDLLRALGEETMGLLSLSRRADLLNGISAHEWRKAWDSITLPELFALGDRYARHYPKDLWISQATLALREVAKTDKDSHLNVLGAVPTHIFGCNHPHLLTDAPYEEYEHHLSPEMGERSAEFKLFLVFQGDRLGLQPEVLENADEKLAVKAFRKAQMTDYRDWRSLLNAYASVNPADLQQAIRNE